MDCQEHGQITGWGRITKADHPVWEHDLDKGELIIKWETIAPMGVPLSGLGEYNGQEVWFLTHNYDHNSKDKSQIIYVLYQLSESSRQVVEAEHQRFIEEVGYCSDYGAKYQSNYKEGLITTFKRQLKISELEVKVLARINYSQIKNKYPQSVVID